MLINNALTVSNIGRLEVKIAADCIAPDVEILEVEILEDGVLVLENVRFYKEEEKTNPALASLLIWTESHKTPPVHPNKLGLHSVVVADQNTNQDNYSSE